MAKLIATYIPTLICLLGFDALWLWLVALPMFRGTLGPDLLTFRAGPGVLFYLVYTAGVVVFVVPAAAGRGWPVMAMYGALFGLFTYATYDLTNLATLRPWTPALAAADIGWGMVLTAVASTLGNAAGQAILRRLLP
jgi:uncharacterized membrane protein